MTLHGGQGWQPEGSPHGLDPLGYDVLSGLGGPKTQFPRALASSYQWSEIMQACASQCANEQNFLHNSQAFEGA